MPHSSHDALTTVVDAVVRLQPSTVLDIGPGYGKWGLLVREALDFMAGRHDRTEFAARIDGLEAFSGFHSPLHGWVYDEIVHGNVIQMVDDLAAYDLVIMGDVIEHMTKPEGVRVLTSLLGRCRNVIVVTPSLFFQQDFSANPWDEHKSLWTREDFRSWPYEFEQVGSTNIAVLAGVDATWPTVRDGQINDFVYATPWLRHGSVRPKMLKAVGRKLLR